MKIGKWTIGWKDYTTGMRLFIEHKVNIAGSIGVATDRGVTLGYLIKHPMTGWRWLTGRSIK